MVSTQRASRALPATCLALLAAGALCAGAQAAPPVVGVPVQLAPPNACLSTTAAGGCTAFGEGPFKESLAIAGAEAIATSGDGLNVYAGGDNGGGVTFSRGAGGILSPIGGAGGFADTAFAVSGAGLFVSVRDTGDNNGEVDALAREPNGALSPVNSVTDKCNTGEARCEKNNGLYDVEGVAVSPNGAHVYAASHFGGGGKTGGALTAFSRNLSTQAIAQLQCVPQTTTKSGPCSEGSAVEGLEGADGIALSPDGKFLYATGDFADSVLGFNIVQSGPQAGQIGSLVNCLWGGATDFECSQTPGMGSADGIAISPDGRDVYVAMFNDGVTALRRDPVSGVLSFNQCFTASGGGGCAADPTLVAGARNVVVSPDGRYVYLAGGGGKTGYVRAYARDALTGQLAPIGCLSYEGIPGCSTAAGLANADGLAISPDGRNLYVTAFEGGDGNGAVATFRIESAPSCQGASASVAAGSSVSIPLTCVDEDGDPIARAVLTAPSGGALGAIDQAAGTVAYTPVSSFTGADGFTFQASDGTNASAPASVSITVTPPLGIKGPPPIAGPRSHILGLAHRVRAAKLKSFHGSASGGRPIGRVEVALVRLVAGAHSSSAAEHRPQARCQQLSSKGRLIPLKISHGRCTAPRFLLARGTSTWSFKLPHRLSAGSYVLSTRATDTSGLRESTFSAGLGNRVSFTVR